jgi:hypothetical protein
VEGDNVDEIARVSFSCNMGFVISFVAWEVSPLDSRDNGEDSDSNPENNSSFKNVKNKSSSLSSFGGDTGAPTKLGFETATVAMMMVRYGIQSNK